MWQGAAPVGSGTISATAAALRTAIDAADYVMHIEMLPGGGAPYAAAELIGPNKYREFGGLLGILASHCGQWELLLAVLERAGASPRLVT